MIYMIIMKVTRMRSFRIRLKLILVQVMHSRKQYIGV